MFRLNLDGWIRLLVAATGCLLLLAAIAVFFPVSLMSRMHAWLAMGDFPERPITIYLARSTSALYAVHGSVMLSVSLNYRQLRSMVPLLGWIHAVLGAVLLWIDWNAGMPVYWTLLEGPPVCGFGVLLLVLWRQSRSLRTVEQTG